MNGTIILTSIGTSTEICRNKILELLLSLKNKNAILITTAAKDKENNKWNILTKQQLLSLGYENVDFHDLETSPIINIENYDTIYVCGGNTFKLMKAVKESNFKEKVLNVLNRGGIYIGASAGALILSPTISIAGEVEPDDNEVGLEDMSGMNIIDFEILPHYSPEQDPQISDYKLKTNIEIKLITNEEIIVLEY
jgi:dipeptidase E